MAVMPTRRPRQRGQQTVPHMRNPADTRSPRVAIAINCGGAAITLVRNKQNRPLRAAIQIPVRRDVHKRVSKRVRADRSVFADHLRPLLRHGWR